MSRVVCVCGMCELMSQAIKWKARRDAAWRGTYVRDREAIS